MPNVHELARQVLHAEELPKLRAGLCSLFTSMTGSAEPYCEVSEFSSGGGPFDYLGTPGEWTEERMLFLLLLAETNPEDFEADAVSEVEILMLHGMTEEQAKQAAAYRLLGDLGPFVPGDVDRPMVSRWLWGAFVWSLTPEGHDYWYDITRRLQDVGR